MNSVVLPKSRMHPKIIRFKQNFLNDLQLVFDNLVDITDPICQAISSVKADMTIFDSSGIEAPATDNNPNYVNTIIKQLKAYAKAQSFNKSYALSKEVCVSMSSYASSNPQIKQLYSKLLVSTLKDSFSKHPLINQKHSLAMHLSIQWHSISIFLAVMLLVLTNISRKPIFRFIQNPALKIRVIPSIKMIFHVIPIISQTYEI